MSQTSAWSLGYTFTETLHGTGANAFKSTVLSNSSFDFVVVVVETKQTKTKPQTNKQTKNASGSGSFPLFQTLKGVALGSNL